MDSFNNLTEKKNMPQLLLVVLFIIYLVFNFKTPEVVANLVDSTLGKIVVALVALFLFSYSNPILGVLGIIVAYQLIKSSSIQTGMEALEKYYPTEQKKWSPFTPIHQFPYTLEQEMVKVMASQKFNTNYVKSPYRPVLDDTYDASPILNDM